MIDEKWIIGTLTGIVFSLIALVYRKHEDEIGNIYKTIGELTSEINKKADKDSVSENIRMMSEQFQDFRKEILEEIRNVASSISAVNTEMLKELGRRPTRDEVNSYFQQKLPK